MPVTYNEKIVFRSEKPSYEALSERAAVSIAVARAISKMQVRDSEVCIADCKMKLIQE